MNESLRSTSEKDCRDGGAYPRSASGEASPAVRKYNTFHQTLTEMVAWLTSEGVTHVTMEATDLLEADLSGCVRGGAACRGVIGQRAACQECPWSQERPVDRTMGPMRLLGCVWSGRGG